MIKRRQHQKKEIPFSYQLVLNQWIIKQCGFDPLLSHQLNERTLAPMKQIKDILRDCPEGMGVDNLHIFYKHLAEQWPDKAAISVNDLLRYEQNIVSHTLKINERRNKKIVWKYFQWLSLLFAEIYLDKYFNQRDAMLRSLNEYLRHFNYYWETRNYKTKATEYSLKDLNKICLQNATGSGKTLLMHINFLQFGYYAQNQELGRKLTRTILITPNENLSAQHSRELLSSNIQANRLITDKGDLMYSTSNALAQIDFTEITKFADAQGPNQLAIRSLGDHNLLLVDEAHRGMGSKQETGWFKHRERLVEKGFAFEYSATFKEAIVATKNTEIEQAYIKNVLFDYSYRYFYADGYGKDYRVFNLPKPAAEQEEKIKFNYLAACLLSFYQQIKLYQERRLEFGGYNLEKPLWVFVGKSVSKAAGSKDERETISDVGLIIDFLGQVLKNKRDTAKAIERIVERNAENTGLLDENGNDIFAGSFTYLKELLITAEWNAKDLLRDIYSLVFRAAEGGHLTLSRIKGNGGEILLCAGKDNTPFGLVNVGEASNLVKHIEDKKLENPKRFSNVILMESELGGTLFHQVHDSSSPINILLGSKKFVEGWDCWRVSTLGLMHVGKSEGSQIIQLFGRGVRLKGHGLTLKRSSSATPATAPWHIHYLETLNVFGVQANFMERFKEFLKEEELPSNDQQATYKIPIKHNYDFRKKLKVLRVRIKKRSGAEYNFVTDGKTPTIGEGDVSKSIGGKVIKIDWYPRIQAFGSQDGGSHKDSEGTGDRHKNAGHLERVHLCLLDYDRLYFEMEQFKRERMWHNLNISKRGIRKVFKNSTWYELLVPKQHMEINDIRNKFLWQRMASELMRSYCEEFYNYSKMSFLRQRLELRPLAKTDGNVPQEKEYNLTVDKKEKDMIADITKIQEKIPLSKNEMLQEGGLRALLFDSHLYEPIIYVDDKSKIKITPEYYSKSEFEFIEDLKKYLDMNEVDEEYYLLRNKSRGKGMGFFEAGNFYPDFILWKVIGRKQHIAFIEPHGLVHEGLGSKKINFHKTIKEIERRLGNEKVKLDSFIVTPTKHAKLKWGRDIASLKEMNVLFMNDSKDSYISDMLSKIADIEDN